MPDSALLSPMRSRRDSSRSACWRTGVGHARVGNLLAIFVHDGAVVLAELLANRVHLLAEEVLALLLLRAVLDIVADPLAHLQLGEAFALELERERQPFDDVERFEQLDLLREGRGRANSRRYRRACRRR